MPDTSIPHHGEDVKSSLIDRQARRRVKPVRPARFEHPGQRCRTLFPEILLASVPGDGLLTLGERATACAEQAPILVTWLGTLIAEELSRRLETPWRLLPLVARPMIPSDQSTSSAQVLRELFVQFDSWSQSNVPGAAEVADLLAALTSVTKHGSA